MSEKLYIPIKRRHFATTAAFETDMAGLFQQWGYNEGDEHIGIVMADGTFRYHSRSELFAPGAGVVPLIEAAATEVVVNNGGADINFRVEGDTATTLFVVDAGTDSVTITGPADDTVVFTVITNAKYLLSCTGTDVVINEGGAAITFRVEAVGVSDALQVSTDGGIVMGGLASGINQGASGAGAGELWVDTSDGNTIKLGV